MVGGIPRPGEVPGFGVLPSIPVFEPEGADEVGLQRVVDVQVGLSLKRRTGCVEVPVAVEEIAPWGLGASSWRVVEVVAGIRCWVVNPGPGGDEVLDGGLLFGFGYWGVPEAIKVAIVRS